MKKIVTFGEIMLRLATPAYQRFSQATSLHATFGGGEANVAVSLANYGLKAEFVSRLPKNDIAQACIMNLHKHDVSTENMEFGGERIGIYYLETGAVARPSKVIYDRAYSSISEIKPGMINWEKVFENTCWFHWTGITPALSQSAADTVNEAIQVANSLGITVSTDLNYRKNLWKYGKTASQVMPDLVAGCNIILGNEEDAEMVFNIKAEGSEVTSGRVAHDDYQLVCSQLMNLFPKAQKVIITLRGSINANQNSWSGILWDGKELLKLQPMISPI
jgi:2-dehydro-3-deoxygluconokinase